MLLTMYMILVATSTAMLFLSTTPIMLGINILALALTLSATLASSMSSWYAFLVFLIYIGGMLVMFAYFLALTPNQQMPTKSNMMYLIVTIMTTITVIAATNMKNPLPEEIHQGNLYLYSFSSCSMLMMLALILLLTMVIVVKLTTLSKGPLRPFN
uniref:NADH dehydrogenase subunit 6 n=1 Tax=Tonoscolex birmanicus TaxID=1405561 RepID=U3R5Y2_9ANNE|nr:NADH dehydrogenase subunit 6 [Tonoscolex birmanicus]AGW95953.1 NADH dehydrogenase subunit 6 [Tonoscolex birmanicus]